MKYKYNFFRVLGFPWELLEKFNKISFDFLKPRIGNVLAAIICSVVFTAIVLGPILLIPDKYIFLYVFPMMISGCIYDETKSLR